MVRNDGERLAILETGLSYIKDKVDHIDKRFEELVSLLQTHYVQQSHIHDLEKKLNTLEKLVQSNKEHQIKVSAIFGTALTILTFLLNYLL